MQNIFNMQGEKFDPCVLTPVRPVVTVRFRLEKVSRRKDNQRLMEVMVKHRIEGREGKGRVSCFHIE